MLATTHPSGLGKSTADIGKAAILRTASAKKENSGSILQASHTAKGDEISDVKPASKPRGTRTKPTKGTSTGLTKIPLSERYPKWYTIKGPVPKVARIGTITLRHIAFRLL